MTKRENGDQRFDVLYHTRYRAVYGYYRSCRLTDAEAADLAQDAFLRLWQRMDQIRGDDTWPFLQSIARSVLLNWLRARHTVKGGGGVKLVEIDDPDFKHEIAAPSGPDYADVEEAARRRTSLFRSIAELPPSQQQALRLQLAGFKYPEIAKILGITQDAVKSRIRDAKRGLRARLGAEELPEDEE